MAATRILAPRNFYRILHNIADKQVGPVERAFLRAIAAAKGAINPTLLARALHGSDARAVIAALRLDTLDREMRRSLLRKLHAIYVQAGIATSALAPVAVNLRFDITNPRALKFAETRSARLVTVVNKAMRETVRKSLERGGMPDVDEAVAAGANAAAQVVRGVEKTH